jgi:hypothetical protein
MASGVVCLVVLVYEQMLTCAGVWSPLLSITLVRTVSFSIYQRSKYALDDWTYQATGSSPLVIACFGLAGAGAGASITAIACMRPRYDS